MALKWTSTRSSPTSAAHLVYREQILQRACDVTHQGHPRSQPKQPLCGCDYELRLGVEPGVHRGGNNVDSTSCGIQCSRHGAYSGLQGATKSHRDISNVRGTLGNVKVRANTAV